MGSREINYGQSSSVGATYQQEKQLTLIKLRRSEMLAWNSLHLSERVYIQTYVLPKQKDGALYSVDPWNRIKIKKEVTVKQLPFSK